MPRPKPKKASPSFTAPSHPLGESARTKLIELLGFDPSQGKDLEAAAPAIADVEMWLGAYPAAESNLDRAPRPTEYVATFERMQRETVRVLARLTGLNAYFREELRKKGADIYAIEDALRSVAHASGAIADEFRPRPSKGARRHLALPEIIKQLRVIFRQHYRGPREPRPRRGPFEPLSVQETRELEFVDTALRDARIIRSSQSKSDLRRLFNDARCFPHGAPPLIHPSDADRRAKRAFETLGIEQAPGLTSAFQAERGELIEGIAKKARRAGQQKKNVT